MSLAMNLGPQRNLLDETDEHAKQIRITQPVLTGRAMSALRSVTDQDLRAVTLPALFAVDDGAAALELAVDELCRAASREVAKGCGLLVLSDCGVNADHAPVPAALAVAAVHHHLI